MSIINPNTEITHKIVDAISKNDGYCPCRVEKSDDTKCPCKDFRENDHCCCNLFVSE